MASRRKRYRKIPKISPGACICSKVLFEGLIFGGAYLRFKIDWANLIVGRKFTVFALYCLYLRAISKYKLQEGLIFGGAI